MAERFPSLDTGEFFTSLEWDNLLVEELKKKKKDENEERCKCIVFATPLENERPIYKSSLEFEKACGKNYKDKIFRIIRNKLVIGG